MNRKGRRKKKKRRKQNRQMWKECGQPKCVGKVTKQKDEWEGDYRMKTTKQAFKKVKSNETGFNYFKCDAIQIHKISEDLLPYKQLLHG